ncbi:hypothetical protein P3L10_011465 [Capsicum annuum]
MVGKVKSVENDMESFLGLVGKEDVSYKDWSMYSSISLLQSFEISKFEEHDGQKDSVKYLGRYCYQSRETKGKKTGNTPIVVPGPKQSLRGPTHQYCQLQSRAYISNPLTHLQQGASFQNTRIGHSIEDCHASKREIEKMIQDKSIMVQNIDSEERSSHADMQTNG